MNMFLYDYLFTVWEDNFLNVILQNHARLLFFLTRVVPLLSICLFFFMLNFILFFIFLNAFPVVGLVKLSLSGCKTK